MIFWTKIRDKMIFWRFPKSVSVLYNNEMKVLHPAGTLQEPASRLPPAAPALGMLAGLRPGGLWVDHSTTDYWVQKN